MKKKSRTSGIFLASVIGLFVLIFAAGAFLAQRGLSQVFGGGQLDLDAPLSSDNRTIRVTVATGDSAATIGQRLEERGLIRSAIAFRMQARSKGVESRLAAGEYDLRPNMRPSEILHVMQQAKDPGINVTFPEGWRREEMADRLAHHGLMERNDFLKATNAAVYPYDFLPKHSTSSVEGFLFPDTYSFARTVAASAVVEIMLRNFDRRFDIAMRQQVQRQGLSVAQVVTLAAIVERETAVPEERPIVAEVFLNRLGRGMPLQADPTVQYAIVAGDGAVPPVGGYWKGDLSIADLQVASPYNTYLNPGLPPGPIANPGLAALKAVLSPTNTGYLYFVAKSDGSHAFARTLEDHNNNVARLRNGGRPR